MNVFLYVHYIYRVIQNRGNKNEIKHTSKNKKFRNQLQLSDIGIVFANIVYKLEYEI